MANFESACCPHLTINADKVLLQIYKLCRANYTFNLLSHVFNVHKGIKEDDTMYSKVVTAHTKQFWKMRYLFFCCREFPRYACEFTERFPVTLPKSTSSTQTLQQDVDLLRFENFQLFLKLSHKSFTLLRVFRICQMFPYFFQEYSECSRNSRNFQSI